MDGWRRVHRILAVLGLAPHRCVRAALPAGLDGHHGNVDARAAVDPVMAGAAIVGNETPRKTKNRIRGV
jgi:hypothetical protein